MGFLSATSQAVILARGLGTRMRRSDGTSLDEVQRSAAAAGQKGMIPVGRPFLEYVVSALADAGITEVVVVVGPEPGPLREHFTTVSPPVRTAVRFAVQEQPRGTSDALFAARHAVRDAPFLMLNADNYYLPATLRAAVAINGNGLVAFEADTLVRESGIDADRVLRYALLDINDQGMLRAIREKPAADDPLALATERWVSMNLWSFTPAIFEACERVRPSPRGELELQDTVSIGMRELGLSFAVVRERAGVLDLSRRADIASVKRRLAGIVPRP